MTDETPFWWYQSTSFFHLNVKWLLFLSSFPIQRINVFQEIKSMNGGGRVCGYEAREERRKEIVCMCVCVCMCVLRGVLTWKWGLLSTIGLGGCWRDLLATPRGGTRVRRRITWRPPSLTFRTLTDFPITLSIILYPAFFLTLPLPPFFSLSLAPREDWMPRGYKNTWFTIHF